MIRARAVGVVLLCLLVGLTGCTGGQPVARGRATPSAPVSANLPRPGGPGADASGLSSQKSAANIPDCPVTPAAAPRDGGLPDVTLECLGGGRAVRLPGLRGTPMVINIWAQWCGPCRTEAPFLAEVHRGAGDRVLFLGVDYLDPYPDRAIEFARAAGWRYPQLVDPEGALQVPLRVPGLPTTVFVAADGTVAYSHSGPITSADQLRELITTKLGVTG